MSIETADFNNDLLLDIFSTDMHVEDTRIKQNYCEPIQEMRVSSESVVKIILRPLSSPLPSIIRIVRKFSMKLDGKPEWKKKSSRKNASLTRLRDYAMTQRDAELCYSLGSVDPLQGIGMRVFYRVTEDSGSHFNP